MAQARIDTKRVASAGGNSPAGGQPGEIKEGSRKSRRLKKTVAGHTKELEVS